MGLGTLGTFLSPGESSGKGWKAGKLQIIIQQQHGWFRIMPWPWLEQLPGLKRQECHSSFPRLFWRVLCVLLQCLCTTQAGLHRSLEFSEVIHYLLSLMSDVGQNSFLLLPPQNIDGKGEMLSAWKLMLIFCCFLSGLGCACMLKWERVMKTVTLKQSKLGIWKRLRKERATICNSSLSGKNRTL